MADLNSKKTTFDLAEIEPLAEINDWKMNTCGTPPEDKTRLRIKESQCWKKPTPHKARAFKQNDWNFKEGSAGGEWPGCARVLQMKILRCALGVARFGSWVNFGEGVSPCWRRLSSSRVLENLKWEALNPSLEAECEAGEVGNQHRPSTPSPQSVPGFRANVWGKKRKNKTSTGRLGCMASFSRTGRSLVWMEFGVCSARLGSWVVTILNAELETQISALCMKVYGVFSPESWHLFPSRTRGNGFQFRLDFRENFITGRGCPGQRWSLRSWKCSKMSGCVIWMVYFRWDLVKGWAWFSWRFFPTLLIPWFCNITSPFNWGEGFSFLFFYLHLNSRSFKVCPWLLWAQSRAPWPWISERSSRRFFNLISNGQSDWSNEMRVTLCPWKA